jgi:hypothetical protein
MATLTHTYLTSSTFVPTASITSASVQVWGAGGHGNTGGSGGSGGAFASCSINFVSGSTYTILVGQATSSNGGLSNITSASVVLVQAPGGNSDGTITSNGYASYLTGSFFTASGGTGGARATGSGQVNGGGGGSSAGTAAVGVAGSSSLLSGASFSQAGMNPNVSNTTSSLYASPEGAPAGATAPTGGGSGGNGAYYLAQTDAALLPAQSGSFPGGGGGGNDLISFNRGVDNSAAGANGQVTITY